ncbi:hypothetical protein NKR23_g8946 [Pleurostoma richardsiae]|uniref:Uncharacterized protein n=1 Tax=Pleurostoma richardsiae TaxID=41990 RepID=A0AA38RH60_9PEZI|nr:hypothetical protein NKR23_g8946 [Pleurostoma richardsiae]
MRGPNHRSRPWNILENPLEVGLCAYSIAQTYDAAGLASLAKERVEHFSDQLAPMDFLRAVKRVSRWLASSADHAWLYDLVKSRVHQLFEDPESLDRKGWLELFEPAGTLSKMLSQSMMEELCCCKTSTYTPSASSAEAGPLIPEPPEPIDIPVERPQTEPEPGPELPEAVDIPDEVLGKPMEPEPEAELPRDTGTAVTPSEFTSRAGPSITWPDQLQNTSQDQDSPTLISKKDKKKKKKMKMKTKLALAEDCPDHEHHLLGDGDAWRDCAGCTEVGRKLSKSCLLLYVLVVLGMVTLRKLKCIFKGA